MLNSPVVRRPGRRWWGCMQPAWSGCTTGTNSRARGRIACVTPPPTPTGLPPLAPLCARSATPLAWVGGRGVEWLPCRRAHAPPPAPHALFTYLPLSPASPLIAAPRLASPPPPPRLPLPHACPRLSLASHHTPLVASYTYRRGRQTLWLRAGAECWQRNGKAVKHGFLSTNMGGGRHF